LDGPKESHDLVRRTKNNRGSYDIITQNIDLLRKVGHPPNTIVCTLGEHNIDALDQFLKYASDNMLCATINDAFAEPRNKVYCCGEQKILESLLNAERVSKRLKVPMDGTWKWPYNKLFSDRPGCLRHCAACGGEMCVDCNGNIKPCPGFAEYFGNVSDIEAALRSDNYLRFKSRAVPNLPDCVGCEIEGLCSGGCMLNASKNHSGNIFKKSESCFLNKNAFKSLAYDFIERNEVRTKP
jgi:uncharacterized protein